MVEISKIKNDSLFAETSFFLRYTEVSPDQFLTGIGSKEEFVLEWVRVFHHYGFIGVIVSLDKLIHQYYDNDTQSWWDEALSTMEHHEMIHPIRQAFCKYAENRMAVFGNLKHFMAPNAEIQTKIWEAYPADKVRILKENTEFNVGFLSVGRFDITDEYCELLEQYGLPALFELANQRDDIFQSNPRQEAIVRKLCRDYVSELTFIYMPHFLNRCDDVFRFSESELEQMRPAGFRNLIMKSSDHERFPTYLTYGWVEKLSELLCIHRKYLPESDCYLLSQIVIVLMQCAGMNADASDAIISLLEQLNVREKSSSIILMALYRALSLERNIYRTKLFGVMQAIFEHEKIPQQAIDWAKDVYHFYQDYAKDLAGRFDEKYLKKRIESSDNDNNVLFYEACLFYLKNDIIDNDIKWVSSAYFENNKLLSGLQQLIEQMENPEVEYQNKLFAFHSFCSLFFALFSYGKTDPRLQKQECNRLLNLDSSGNADTYEVFELYSPRQIQLLRKYQQRAEAIIETIPSTHTVIKYKKLSFNSNDSRISKLEEIVAQHDLAINKLDAYCKRASQTFSFLLSSVRSNDEISKLLMSAFSNNPEESQKFCSSVYTLLKEDNSNIIDEKTSDNLFSLAEMVESAIDSSSKNELACTIKEELPTIIDNLIDCIPGFDNIKRGIEITQSLKVIFQAAVNVWKAKHPRK